MLWVYNLAIDMRALWIFIVIFVCTLPLHGCGFKVIHNSEDAAVLPIEIGKIEFFKHRAERLQYAVRQELSSDFCNQSDSPYILDMTITKSLVSFGYGDKNVSTTNKITLVANFTLKSRDGAVMLNESVTAASNASLTDSPYAIFVTDEATTIGLAASLCQQIVAKCRLHLLLHQGRDVK
jgi:hypothetical protein